MDAMPTRIYVQAQLGFEMPLVKTPVGILPQEVSLVDWQEDGRRAMRTAPHSHVFRTILRILACGSVARRMNNRMRTNATRMAGAPHATMMSTGAIAVCPLGRPLAMWNVPRILNKRIASPVARPKEWNRPAKNGTLTAW